MFSCTRCGFCCQLDVRLSADDIKRLKANGRRDFITKKENGIFLTRKDGYCIFYDRGCTVYNDRPEICRKFPIESDGSISSKCTTRRDFSARVDRKVIMFINNEIDKT